MFDAVIFDMDGVILDSEPFWRQADMIAFSKVGVPLTEEMCHQTTGLGTYETILHWYERYPWDNLSFDEVTECLYSNLFSLVKEHGVLNPGMVNLLEMFASKGLKMGVASSSPPEYLHLVLNKFGIQHYFQVVHSANNEPHSKPHPAVYLGAAKLLGADALKCLAFEDSFNGILAAKSARMKTVAILEEQNFANTRFDFADVKLRSLTEFTEAMLEKLAN